MNMSTLGNPDSDVNSLTKMFEDALELSDELEITDCPSAGDEYQILVTKGIKLLEEATHLVNKIGMFSCNEIIDEVATSDLKYLLLPALLGYFTSKLKYISPGNRLEKLKLTELYYKDFLKRCKSYEMPDVNIPRLNDGDDDNVDEDKNVKSDLPVDLNQMAAKRNAVINRYQQTKEMKQKLSSLKNALVSEEARREYYILLLKKWINSALEELNSIKMEKSILAGMIKAPLNTKKEEKRVRSEPLKPVIIVKTELQKKVFGLGYPSVPTLTVDEFYKQRYPEGDNHVVPNSGRSLQQMAYDPDAAKNRDEAEDIEEEEKIERDDPLTLQKARAFDDWKDENRRGCGNMKNKG